MRIISFTQKWPKLMNLKFTTFRYPYWKLGESVQLYYKNRSPERRRLGVGTIVDIEKVVVEPGAYPDIYRLITTEEAVADGFGSLAEMVKWLKKIYGVKYSPIIDKLTIVWISRESFVNQKEEGK